MSYLLEPTVQLTALSVAAILVHAFIRNHSLRFFADTLLFALLTATLLFNDIEPYEPVAASEALSLCLFYGAVKAAWWISGALMLVSSVRVFLIFERRPREARLLQDLVAALIYVGAALAIVAYVFNVPVGTLIATSGVVAVILGLALQSTLSDLFSGVALNLGRPYSVGDWIVLDTGMQGRVVETNWRATHLLNAANDLVVIPNSALAKSQLVNLSSPDETHGVTVSIRAATTRGPSEVERLFGQVLAGSRHALQCPAPVVTLSEMDGQSISVELAFRVADAGHIIPARNEMFDLIFRHAGAAGLNLTSPPTSPFILPQPDASLADPQTDEYRLLRAMPLFRSLGEDEIRQLSASLVRRDVAKNEVIVEQGAKSPTLMFVGRGVVMIQRKTRDRLFELNRLSPGDFFGEHGVLMGSGEPGTITAVTPAVVYEMPSEGLADVMRERARLVDELGATLATRLEHEANAEGNTLPPAHRSLGVALRIRHLFRLPAPSRNGS